MKRSLFCLAILLLAIFDPLLGQSKALEFYLYDSDNSTLIEQNLIYEMIPLKNLFMTVKASSAQEKRSSFNQSSSQNRLSIVFFDIISC